MRRPTYVALGIALTCGLFPAVDLAGAGGLTDSLQSERMTVVEVNATHGQIVCVNGNPEKRIVHRAAEAFERLGDLEVAQRARRMAETLS